MLTAASIVSAIQWTSGNNDGLLTGEGIFGSLWLAWGALSGLATTVVLAPIAALNFFLENCGFLLDLAEAVLDGVVSRIEMKSDLAVVDLEVVSSDMRVEPVVIP